MKRRVEIDFPPTRIVSIVPSQTELLYDLGLTDEVVGQTLFCIHPHTMHETKPRVGRTKKLNLGKIAALKPDLIIGNKEENDEVQVKELMNRFPVWMSDIKNLDDALDMIKKVGEMVGRPAQADRLSASIIERFEGLQQHSTSTKVAYLIWREPWMAAGADTFINDMLARCGFANIFGAESGRYPSFDPALLANEKPDLILLSSEPYPFKANHIAELRNVCPEAQVLLVDGELFSWYGSRLLKSVDYFSDLLQQIR